MNRRPSARLQPRPPSARRRPPPAYLGPRPRRHRSRVPLVILLLLVTAVAVGYFVVQSRSSASGTPQDFVHTTQRIEHEARSLPVLATKVQRFTELHAFDQSARGVIAAMERDVYRIHQIASGSSGTDKAITDQAASAADQALHAASAYQYSVAYTYRLGNASAAEQDLNAAVAQLKQQEQAWAHR